MFVFLDAVAMVLTLVHAAAPRPCGSLELRRGLQTCGTVPQSLRTLAARKDTLAVRWHSSLQCAKPSSVSSSVPNNGYLYTPAAVLSYMAIPREVPLFYNIGI